MKNFNFQAMLKHGFLIIPKALLQQQIEDRHMQEGEIEALLKILMKVNYSDTLYNDRQNKNCLCKRYRRPALHCVKEAKACLVIATGATSSTGLSEKPSGSYTSLPRWEL